MEVCCFALSAWSGRPSPEKGKARCREEDGSGLNSKCGVGGGYTAFGYRHHIWEEKMTDKEYLLPAQLNGNAVLCSIFAQIVAAQSRVDMSCSDRAM